MRAIDLNSDLAEGYGAYRLTEDEALLDLVSSANVACGLHAGDPEIMARTFRLAKDKGVAVGAHPGFPDLWGYYRRIYTPSLADAIRERLSSILTWKKKRNRSNTSCTVVAAT